MFCSELLDEVTMESFNKFSKEMNYKEAPTLFLEFHGGESEVEGQAEATGLRLRLLWFVAVAIT